MEISQGHRVWGPWRRGEAQARNMRQPQEHRQEIGLDGERQGWGQIRDWWRQLEEVDCKDRGGGAVPERGAHTKGTVRKGTEPRLGSSSRAQTGSGGA